MNQDELLKARKWVHIMSVAAAVIISFLFLAIRMDLSTSTGIIFETLNRFLWAGPWRALTLLLSSAALFFSFGMIYRSFEKQSDYIEYYGGMLWYRDICWRAFGAILLVTALTIEFICYL